MTHKGCGAIQKIYLNNFSEVQNIISKKLNNKEKKIIDLIKARLLEVAIIDELYNSYKIFAYYTLSTIVISPALVIKTKELNYFFDCLDKILNIGVENIIVKYLNRLKK